MSELCSFCQVVEARPFCVASGLVHRSFSIGGRYDVEDLIGAGQTSFVFAARARPAGRLVAVKVLRPPTTAAPAKAANKARQRFLRGAAALGKLGHEHIVGVIDFGWDSALGVAYLVMNRLSGQTADAMVRRSGPLPWQQAVPMLMQIGRAVAAAHAHGIVDGSLRARDVFVTAGPGQAVKLCDVGLASTASDDPRDDIHGIGTIAHELMTGRPPPEGNRASDAVDDPVGMNEQDPALGVPNRLDELLRACRLRNPMLRPSLDEIAATLRLLDAASGGEAAPSTQVVTAIDPRAMPAMIGSYRVVAEIGAGGTGRVYLGQHPVIGSQVAIKVLLPEIAQSAETVGRFLLEARASSQIGSPHIPRYFDVGTTPAGLPYAIMEYFEGETLGKRLARTGTMSVADTAQILEQVASALLMAHEAGLVHCDLKPDNILLVNPDGKAARSTARPGAHGAGPARPGFEVKLLDFGIAKMVGSRSANQTLTGAFLGTPFYCAPEQVFGRDVDARADVYSLGATAFEMLTGAPPFVGEVPEILASKATEDPPELRGASIPPAVAHTIRRMLAREPAQRAPSMAWVLEELAGWTEPGELDAPRARSTTGSCTVVERPARTVDPPALPGDPRAAARAPSSAPPDDASDAAFDHARTGLVTKSAAHDLATTRPVVYVLARSHARAWRRAALRITGWAFTVAALAVVPGESPRSAPPSSPPDAHASPPGGTADVAAPQPALPGPPEPAWPREREVRGHDASSSAEPPGSTTPEAPPTAAPSADAGGAAVDPGASATSPPLRPDIPDLPVDSRASKPAEELATRGAASAHRPRTKPALDKKRPPKPPPPGEPRDALTVAPLSRGN